MEDESLKSLSLDYLNLLINGQSFSDVTFSVDGRLVHGHRCILAARSLFFRKFFSGPDSPPPSDHHHRGGSRALPSQVVVPVNSVAYEVFLLVLQFLYSGQVSLVPQRHEQRPNCRDRGCWHTHCSSAVDLALDTLTAARCFGVEQLVLITQKQLASMVEKASIEDVMRVLMASHKQDLHQLWTTCSRLIAKSGLPPEILSKHLPMEVVARITELRLAASSFSHHNRRTASPFAIPADDATGGHHHHKILRMRQALDSSDVELVKLMVMGEGLDLDAALALHYAVESCGREVVKALLELGAADVNFPAGPAGKTPLHVAAEMMCPDMVAVLLDHHADPNIRTVDGVTPLDILRTLTSEFLFKGAVPGLNPIEPNKLRLCLELVQSAAMVLSREEAEGNNLSIYPSMNAELPNNGTHHHRPYDHQHHNSSTTSGGNANTTSGMVNLSLDSRMVYLNLGGNKQLSDHGGEDHESGGNINRGEGGGTSSTGVGPSSMYSPHGFPN